MHVPEEIADAARAEAATLGADCCVAVGGGSTTGLAKAIALTSELPIIAIPTTYAGSEMTPIWGITADGVKKTGRDTRVLPKTVIYDPNLTLGLPVPMSVTSGINAMAHCVEALYSKDANPIVSLMAEEGIRAMAQALPKIVKDPDNADARAQALYGAWLGGSVLGAVGMALHHKLCHTLGGSFNLPHAETHTVDPAPRHGLQRSRHLASHDPRREGPRHTRCRRRNVGSRSLARRPDIPASPSEWSAVTWNARQTWPSPIPTGIPAASPETACANCWKTPSKARRPSSPIVN